MRETSVMIIPVRNEAHLRWIMQTRKADYRKKKPSRELSLFDNEDYFFAETRVAHVVLLSYKAASSRYLTCLPASEGAEPTAAGEEELSQLSYPFGQGEQVGSAKYLLMGVDTSRVLKPSLNISADKLAAFLKKHSAGDVASVYTTDELRTAGVIQDGNGGDLPDDSYDMLLEVRNDMNKRPQSVVAPQANSAAHYANQRSAKERLRVTFRDGTVLCDRNAVNTFVQTIEKIGVERVAALHMEYFKTPLLSREYSTNKNYKALQREVDDGWILFTLDSTTTKQIVLLNVSNKLQLGLKIERGADLAPVTETKKLFKKAAKNSLVVTLGDGTTISGENSRDTYVKALRHIGLDKVRRLSANIQGVPLVTTYPVAKVSQVDEHNGLYITIPNGTKKMYKYLMLIASFTHTKLKVTII